MSANSEHLSATCCGEPGLQSQCPNRQLHRLALATFICIVVGCSLDYYITRHRDTTSLLTYLSAIPTFKSVVYWRVRVLNYDVTSRPTSTSFGSMSSVTYLSAFLWCLLLFIKDYGKDLHQKRFFSYKAGGGDPFAAVHFDNVSTPTQDKHNQSAPLFQMHLKILRGTEVNLLGGVTSGTNIVERVVSGLSPVSTGRVWWNGNQLGPAFAEVGGRQIVQGLLSSKRKVGTQLKFVLSMRRADLSPHQVDVHVGRVRILHTDPCDTHPLHAKARGRRRSGFPLSARPMPVRHRLVGYGGAGGGVSPSLSYSHPNDFAGAYRRNHRGTDGVRHDIRALRRRAWAGGLVHELPHNHGVWVRDGLWPTRTHRASPATSKRRCHPSPTA